MLRIFTMEYDPLKKGFDDKDLNAFLAGKSIIGIEKRFFKQNSKYYWTFAVEYDVKNEASPVPELENEAQRELFLALKEWRNDLAAEKGIPPYLMFTNNQLQKVAIVRPKTLKELKSISIISSKKADEYGEGVLKVISENEGNGQEQPVSDICPVD